MRHQALNSLWNHVQALCPIVRHKVLPNGAGAIGRRFYSPAPAKRFYAEVTVHPSSDSKSLNSFEIHLDKKKLKTPGGKLFTVKNESIAQAIAAEWASQKSHILQSHMHLTALANTVQDNPLHKTKDDVLTSIINSLSQDTILFRNQEKPKLLERQEKEWDPIVAWFENEYNVTMPIFEASIVPTVFISKETVKNVLSALHEFSIESLHGLHFGVGSVQSLILPLAVLSQRLTVEEAVDLSRLELSFQIEHWGNVEWAHDLEKYDSLSRFSAAIIFIYAHSKSPFPQLTLRNL